MGYCHTAGSDGNAMEPFFGHSRLVGPHFIFCSRMYSLRKRFNSALLMRILTKMPSKRLSNRIILSTVINTTISCFFLDFITITIDHSDLKSLIEQLSQSNSEYAQEFYQIRKRRREKRQYSKKDGHCYWLWLWRKFLSLIIRLLWYSLILRRRVVKSFLYRLAHGVLISIYNNLCQGKWVTSVLKCDWKSVI